MRDTSLIGRRTLLAGGLAALATGARAGERPLILTPGQVEGPFYPVQFPADSDNDLVRVTGRAAQAMGQVTHLGGRILDRQGRPIPSAAVEIWQCDAHGIYRHPRAADQALFDDAFQGYGRTMADAAGVYRFRTIRPVAYPGRTPHIHVAVQVPHRGLRFVTQMYVAGEPLNARDGLLQGVRDRAARESLIVPLSPSPEGLEATFDIVLAV
ncbi:protocatechuate 3,4-dioxygenase [Salinarimonas soli]|uniref:Intradiol ring-cleavage dioxygenase n=1 Tax=Salinarimonas soli TaxID=1638099 RepID=A0A5B2VT06_9HYPH|nr:protocatechuate 3,4-dioxygenase [Salinarimonas soli]KAA2242135.1 intradiol ring-cleavage dioxygenase [Salinarimonas soli]